MSGVGIEVVEEINRRVRATDYLSVAELYLKNNFLLEQPLRPEDIKPRLLGHWGTCHGINVAYANLAYYYRDDENFSFVLGPGHGFPALQANLFIDGILKKYDDKATLDYAGIEYICRNFSWPDGFPSHASPFTPGVITEGGELGYALANAYGVALGHPEKTVAVLIGDGELETATALASLNLNSMLSGEGNGKIVPILHLNGYKISAPTIYGRKSERELHELIRGFGFTPIEVTDRDPEAFQVALSTRRPSPFYIMRTEKGAGGPNRHQDAHQIPLKSPRENHDELIMLEKWLKSYHFEELFNPKDGFHLKSDAALRQANLDAARSRIAEDIAGLKKILEIVGQKPSLKKTIEKKIAEKESMRKELANVLMKQEDSEMVSSAKEVTIRKIAENQKNVVKKSTMRSRNDRTRR